MSYHGENLRSAAEQIDRIVDLDLELIHLTGHNLERLVHELKNGASIVYPDKRTTKPPLGVIPRNLWNRKRQEELAAAMQRYLEAGKSIPREWIDEYNELSDKED